MQAVLAQPSSTTVSYTHLDVYKRQELEAAQVTLAAELATAQDEKTSLVSAKSTAEAVAASTAASVAQSQACLLYTSRCV